MAKAVYARKGHVINYTAASDVAYLEVVPFTGRIGVAEMDIAQGASGTVSITGAYVLPKATGEFKAGTAVYWAKSAGNIVTTAEGNIPAGIALEDATSGDTSAVIRIG